MSRFFPRSWHRLAAPSLVTLSFVPFAFGTSASGPVKDLQASHLQWQSAGLGSSTLESLTEQYRVFRDVSLAKGHGGMCICLCVCFDCLHSFIAAIDANGDLIQFSLPLTDKESLAKAESLQLHKTLSGGQLKQLVTTQESVVALGPSNAVYVIPKDQKSGGKIQRGFLWNTAPCDILSTKELKRGEYIQQLAAGSDFVLALSNTGRVLASATDGTLTDNHFLPSSFNASQESSKNKEKSLQLLESCKDLIVAEIACGSQHVLLRTKDGRVFGLGNNDKGV